MEQEIRNEVDNFNSLKLVFSADIQGLSNINQIRNELYYKMFNYDKFVFGIKSNFGRVFARLITTKFEKA